MKMIRFDCNNPRCGNVHYLDGADCIEEAEILMERQKMPEVIRNIVRERYKLDPKAFLANSASHNQILMN